MTIKVAVDDTNHALSKTNKQLALDNNRRMVVVETTWKAENKNYNKKNIKI